MPTINSLKKFDLGNPFHIQTIELILTSYMCYPEDKMNRNVHLKAFALRRSIDYINFQLNDPSFSDNYKQSITNDKDKAIQSVAANLYGIPLESLSVSNIANKKTIPYFESKINTKKSLLIRDWIRCLVYKILQLRIHHNNIIGGSSLSKAIYLLEDEATIKKPRDKFKRQSRYMKMHWKKYRKVAHIIFAYDILFSSVNASPYEIQVNKINSLDKVVLFLNFAYLTQEYLIEIEAFKKKDLWLIPKIDIDELIRKCFIDRILPLTPEKKDKLSGYNYHKKMTK